MVFDYKKEYKEFYIPPKKPGLIEIPEINYIAVRGKGNPNEPEGEYKTAIQLLYGIAYTIKMSNKSGKEIEGYFPYVVPPLEGLWWQQGIEGIDYAHRHRRKRKVIFLRRNFMLIVKGSVYSVCTSEAMTQNQRL